VLVLLERIACADLFKCYSIKVIDEWQANVYDETTVGGSSNG